MIWERDNGLKFECRDETTDWNTVNAAVGEDEYGLGNIHMKGKLVFDVGAHIGSVGVWCAWRGARVICVEPIPENVEMSHLNVRLNACTDRVIVVPQAAGAEGAEITILYGFDSNETERAHAFIGNIGGATGHAPSKTAVVPAASLSGMIQTYGIPDIVKLDCEGGEWAWLAEPEITLVPLIVGEWHPTDGHTAKDVASLLGGTHAVEFTGPIAGPGGFRAVKR